MDDKIFYGFLVYILVVATTFSFLPASFVTGQPEASRTVNELIEETPLTFDTSGADLTYLEKMFILFFMSWSTAGFPAVIGAFVAILNILSISVVIIYLYDKFRGIGS